MAKSRVLLISTGGTITMVQTSSGDLAPAESADILLERVPEVKTLADVDLLPLANIDSSNIDPAVWLRISRELYKRYRDYDGFVITHGTDTLAYTSAALSLMLQELGKPVVVTGSQVPLEEIGSDGRANLINSFRVAVADLAEVSVVFGSQIIRGSRAKKTSAFDMQAFTSANALPLGTIGLSIKFAREAVKRSKRKPMLRPFLESSVCLLPVFPGIRPELVTHVAETHKGIILEGYGAGNIPTEGAFSLVPAIQSATSRGVPVVICTQCLVGSTEMELYRVGRAALQAGAIPAMDMTPEMALVKLMWVLGQTSDLATIDSMMQKSFVGEVHETV